MRVLSYIENSFWLMNQQDFDKMCLTVARNAPELERIAANESFQPQALLTKPTTPMAGTRYVDMRDSVAVIDVNGVIAKRMNMFEEICEGGTSTELLAKDFQTAIDSPQVKAVVFNIHSPGGEAFGMNEIASLIYQARGKKPIKAYVSGQGCSAAYFIAAACDEVIIPKDGMLGSVGVVAEWQDPTEFYKMLGIDRKVVTSSNAPNKRLNLNTDEGMAEFVATLDAMEKPFIKSVAKFRGKTFDEVVQDFNRGGVKVGADAVKAGMADRIGSLEQVISELSKSTKVSANSNSQPKANTKGENTMSLLDKFNAWLASDEVKPLLESTETPEATVAPSAEVETLKTQLAAEQAKNASLAQAKMEEQKTAIADKCSAYVASEKTAGRLTPAEEKDFSAAYMQALTDDAANPLAEGSRASLIEAAQAKRAPHLFHKEVLAPDATAKVLSGDSETEGVSEARKTELLNKTPLGQSALKVVK